MICLFLHPLAGILLPLAVRIAPPIDWPVVGAVLWAKLFPHLVGLALRGGVTVAGVLFVASRARTHHDVRHFKSPYSL
jgi:hypothetical protein